MYTEQPPPDGLKLGPIFDLHRRDRWTHTGFRRCRRLIRRIERGSYRLLSEPQYFGGAYPFFMAWIESEGHEYEAWFEPVTSA